MSSELASAPSTSGLQTRGEDNPSQLFPTGHHKVRTDLYLCDLETQSEEGAAHLCNLETQLRPSPLRSKRVLGGQATPTQAEFGGSSPSPRRARGLDDAGVARLRDGSRVLLFVDNPETIRDARLFRFLDHCLPENVWIIATSRFHKIKNYIYTYDLAEMKSRDAARCCVTN